VTYYLATQDFSFRTQMYGRLRFIAKEITLPDNLSVGIVVKARSVGPDRAEAWFVRVGHPEGRCNVTGKSLRWWGRKFYISPHMTDGEIVQTIFLACKIAQEHELREQFKYKGVSVFDPHYDLDQLVALHHAEEATKERTSIPRH